VKSKCTTTPIHPYCNTCTAAATQKEFKLTTTELDDNNFLHPYEDDTDCFPSPQQDDSEPLSRAVFTNTRDELTGRVCNRGNSIFSVLFSILNSAKQGVIFLNQEDKSRLQFLKNTIELIVEYVGNQTIVTRSLEPYVKLLRLLISRMDEVHDILKKIQHQESSITENFDIFELKLRSHLDELKAMFPIGAIVSPVSIISDAKARKLWEDNFGSEHMVSFTKFLDMLSIAKIYNKNDKRFLLFLRYFVNFPNDDNVTTYKWDLLIRLFGPFDSFLATFSLVVARRGFLGLINRIKAYEILTLEHQPRSVLIRLSRTEPQFLAFSYRNKDGQINHQINKDRVTGLPIPVSQFLQTKFPGYALVKKSVDVEMILGKDGSNGLSLSLSQYASTQSEYITTDQF